MSTILISEPSHVPEKLRRNIASTLTFVRCLLYLLPPLLSLYGQTREKEKNQISGMKPRNGSKQRFIPHVLSAGRWVVGWVDGFGERWRLLGMIFNNWMSGNKVLKWAFGQKALLLLLWVLGAHRTVQSFMGKHILCDRVLIHSGGS